MRGFLVVAGAGVLVALLAVVGGAVLLYRFSAGLPDYKQLANYEPPTVTRLHAADGRLIAEYAAEKRSFVPIDAMPKGVIHAFIAAEDKNFYSHGGVDLGSVFRAALSNIFRTLQDKRPVGGSTITQQVAKNFLLTNEVSYGRKVREAMLAFRIERAYSKDRILELYLNEIYLGSGSYGVAAAALNYFDKSLDQLSIDEAAFLAALPKAPNNYNPVRHNTAAKARRDWVIERMREDGMIGADEATQAQAAPLKVRSRADTEFVAADYFVEEVRRELQARYGDNALYEGGLTVHTTLDPRLQRIADRALRTGLQAYDVRHGWRGPIRHLDQIADLDGALLSVPKPEGLGTWQLAIVLKIRPEAAEIGLAGGTRGAIPLEELRWARAWRVGENLGPPVREAGAVLKTGDVVAVEPLNEDGNGDGRHPHVFALRQIPAINGALVAIDPHTGNVRAMTGGYAFGASEFNRATQAMRQPGSAFKPFVYLAALEAGFTPATLILDAPFVIDQGPGLGKWKPENYTKNFLGPVPMRVGIEKSRNLMTVRLARTIGMDRVADAARRFGVIDDLPQVLSMSLGAGETTLLRLTKAYAMFVNGGKSITPSLIERVQDRHGRTLYRRDDRPCPLCSGPDAVPDEVPDPPDPRVQTTDPVSAYQIVSMLQGVVERGTGQVVGQVGKPLAGKTGTTNEDVDTWFVGFAPDLAVGVFVGFDQPRSLGPEETGARAAAPIFRDFMAGALKGAAARPFRVPPGVRLVRIDPATGMPAGRGGSAIVEAFRPGTEPGGQRTVIDGGVGSDTEVMPASGMGGLY